MMRVALITGACGFSGRHVAKRLAGEGGYRIIGMDLPDSPFGEILLDDYFQADLRDPARTANVLAQVRPDVVFHLAGVLRSTASELYAANVLGTIHLFEAIRQSVPEARVLVVGSAAEYGVPVNPQEALTEDTPCHPVGAYAQSKYAVTLATYDYVRRFRLRIVLARPFNLVGAGMPATLLIGAVIRRIKEASAHNGVVYVGNLESKRDFVAVDDAVDAYIRLVNGEWWGEVFNICSGRPRSIESVVHWLVTRSPYPLRLDVDPQLMRDNDPPCIYGSFTKANRAFGFRPKVSLEVSLQAAWDYERAPSDTVHTARCETFLA